MQEENKPIEKNLGGRPEKYTPEQVEIEVDKYLEQCKIDNTVPFLQELAYRMGVDSDTITRYGHKDRYAAHIKRVKQAGEIGLVKGVANEGKPIGKMFLLKTNYGYVEKQHIQNDININIGDILDGLDKGQDQES